jgi:hypothetical protein
METTIAALSATPLHPFPRYGLAVAVRRSEYQSNPTEAGLRAALAGAIENGLEQFRMETHDDPKLQDETKFVMITANRLREGVNKGAKEGVYLYPHVVASDGSSKETFKNADALIAELQTEGVNLFKCGVELKRSLSPVTGEFNNGRTGDKQNPTGTLLEKACATIATVTPDKPATLVIRDVTDLRYTSVIPDLPLLALVDFITVFRAMVSSRVDASMTATYNATDDAKKKAARTFKRPTLCGGNYPNSPRNTEAFGAVGVLAAIGEWAKVAKAEQRQKAFTVLVSLAGCPLYLVSYDGIKVAQFSHHVVGLAQAAKLRQVVDDLYIRTCFYNHVEDGRPRADSKEFNDYRLFFLMAARFLQSFDAPALRDFLAFRTEYALSLLPLWKAYFMDNNKIPEPIVDAARVLGQWINSAAYFAAKESHGEANVEARILRRDKAKLLTEFESAVLSAKDPTDMLCRVSVRAGRLLGRDAPPEAQAFYDATLQGGMAFLPQAQNMLVAYMRLQSVRTKKLETEPTDAIQPTDELPA